MPILSQWKCNTLEGATSLITSDSLEADRPICKESCAVFRSPEKYNTRYFSKNRYPPKNITYIIDANK